MTHFAEAIRRPFTDWKKLTIGALMYMIPVVNIVTQFFASGYVLVGSKRAMKKKFDMPEWTDWGSMFSKGLLAAIIGLIWAIVPGVLVAAGAAARQDVGVALLVVGALLGVLWAYVAPAAILSYVDEDEFSAGFNFGEIFRVVFTGTWLGAWVVALVWGIVISLIGGLIATLLSPTVVLPFIVVGYASFISQMSAFTMLGEAYKEA